MLLLEVPEWASAEEALRIQQMNHNWFNLNANSCTYAINNITSCSSSWGGVLIHSFVSYSCIHVRACEYWNADNIFLVTSNSETCVMHISPILKGLGIFHPWFSWNPFESPPSHGRTVLCLHHNTICTHYSNQITFLFWIFSFIVCESLSAEHFHFHFELCQVSFITTPQVQLYFGWILFPRKKILKTPI